MADKFSLSVNACAHTDAKYTHYLYETRKTTSCLVAVSRKRNDLTKGAFDVVAIF